MAFCSKCGAQVEDGQKFCTVCGAPIETAQTTINGQPIPEKQAQDSNDISGKIKAALNSGEDKTGQFSVNDVNENKVFAILAYFGILVLIPVLAAKDSKYARFHANQGLLLLIAEIIIIIVDSIPLIGWLIGLVGGILILVFAIKGIIAAAKGEAKELPVIGKYTLLK